MTTAEERILIEALDLLEAGQPPEDLLRRYPEYADELEPYLQTAHQLERMPLQPSIAAKQRSKQAFLATAQLPKTAQVRKPSGLMSWVLRPLFVLLVLTTIVGVGLVSASGSAVPGDALYPAKRGIETSRLILSRNPENQALLRETYQQQRRDEVNQLLALGREAPVMFSGRVDDIGEGELIVAGIPVLLTSDTMVDGVIALGRLIEVDGVTIANAVEADSIIVLDGPVATPPPTPTDPAPESPTDLPGIVSETLTPEPATATVTVTITPTATELAAPTAAPTAPEFVAPTANVPATPAATEEAPPATLAAPATPEVEPTDDADDEPPDPESDDGDAGSADQGGSGERDGED